MKISIIIPCKNESGVVENLLDSLARQTRPADEVIVVDSNCTDDTIARAKTYTKKLPLKTAAATQVGPAHARNRGASKATGDMLIFADADLIFPEYFLQEFEKQINKKHLQAGSFIQRMRSNKFGIRAGAYLMNAYARLMQYTPWPIGFGCLYAAREVFDAVNGFDTSLYIMEDYDLILKAKRAKYRTGIINIAYSTSDRRYQNDSFQVFKGIYGELYRYTHGLRITKPIYKYEMGGKQKKTTK